MFDPYHKWLGIPKDQRPPTLYQLLGVAPAEDDADVIEEAAIRQTAHVRTYQTGPYAQDCARLLKEIALARVTLLNPVKRQVYDASLRPVPSTTAVGDTDGATFDPLADLGDGSLISSPSSARLRRTPRKKSWVKGLLFGGMLHLLAGAAVVWFFFLRPKQPAGPKPDDTKTAHVAAAVQGPGRATETKATERTRSRPGDNQNPDGSGRPLGLPPPSGQPKPDAPNQPDPPIKKEPTPAGTIKTPVPAAAKVALARKAIRDLYQRKFEQLKPGARVPFVKELLQRAREAYEERAEKFAYYCHLRGQ